MSLLRRATGLRTIRVGRLVAVVHPRAWVAPRAGGAWPTTWRDKGWPGPLYRWTVALGPLQLRYESRAERAHQGRPGRPPALTR